MSWTIIPFLISLVFFFWAGDVLPAAAVGAARRHGDHRAGAAMDVEIPASWRTVGDQRPACAGRPPDPHQHRIRRMSSTPCTSRRCACSRMRCRAAPRMLWFKADRVGAYQPVLFRTLRRRPRTDGRDAVCDVAVRLSGLAATGRGRASHWWPVESSCSTAMAAAAATSLRHGACAAAGRAVRPTPCHCRTAASVVADDAYIRDSILQPNQQIVAGYKPVMPSFDGVVSRRTWRTGRLHQVIGQGKRAHAMSPSDAALRDLRVPTPGAGRAG